jgi:hypothetical protein
MLHKYTKTVGGFGVSGAISLWPRPTRLSHRVSYPQWTNAILLVNTTRCQSDSGSALECMGRDPSTTFLSGSGVLKRQPVVGHSQEHTLSRATLSHHKTLTLSFSLQTPPGSPYSACENLTISGTSAWISE